jgi:hypothetical protein
LRIALALLAIGALVLTNSAYRRRAIMRKVSERVEGVDRFVDSSVMIHVVTSDAVPGKEIVEVNGRTLCILRSKAHGGWIDTKSSPPTLGHFSGAATARHWYCSEDQEAALYHKSDKQLAQLIYGSEGAGKTRLLCMWHYLRWIENIGQFREGGQTAPTLGRLGLVKTEMLSAFAPNWGRYAARDDFEGFEMCDGTRIRFRYSHAQSKAKGTPIQGFNWSWCGRDEMQDQVEAHADIQARGRSAKGARYYQLGTATAKDDPEWRTLRDKLETSGLWIRRTLLGPRSPFVHPDHWEAMKATMPLREYKRRVLALDLPPETATYPEWSRETNLIEVPLLGWSDVTANELRGSGHDLHLLVGHDPGLTWDVSVLLKAYVENRYLQAYQSGKFKPLWVVVGEVSTERSTTENHLVDLLKTVRERWQLNLLTRDGRINPNGRQILVRADPAGNNDNRTDRTVYTQFANAGIYIKPGAYNADGDGHGRVPREPAVELINTLICNAANQRRLFVERKGDGSPAAPKLVAAIEQSERDHSGRAEVATIKGGRHDLTHWPAALRYALWAVERPRLQITKERQL